MFVTILLGDSRVEMFNLNCKLIIFIHHLKERCGLDFKGLLNSSGNWVGLVAKDCIIEMNNNILSQHQECVDLMDSSGSVMNLEVRQHSEALASSVLEERQCYVLLHVHRDDDTGGRKYVSLLKNYSQNHPELTELLRKLSNPIKEQDRRIRGGRAQRSSPANQTGSKHISAYDKRHQVK